MRGSDRYGRVLATCFVAGENLNDRIVREGWAIAFRRYTSAYLEAEEEAKRRHVGLWRGDFEPPWEWRQGHRLEAGATRYPICVDPSSCSERVKLTGFCSA